MAKQEVKNEVATKPIPPPPAIYQDMPSVVDSSDIIVPKILLAQGLSVSVADGKAKMGDFTNSLTGAVVGGPASPVVFMPITLKKYWKKFEILGNKKQYRGTEPFTAMNRNRELKETIDGKPYEFDLVIDVFGFTEDDVQDPIALPSAVSFTRTSYKAGQKMNTHFASLDGAIPKIPYHAYKMQLTCKKTQNDKGIFYVFDIAPYLENNKMAKTPEAYYPKIERWSKILSDASKNVVIDDSDEAPTETASVDESRF